MSGMRSVKYLMKKSAKVLERLVLIFNKLITSENVQKILFIPGQKRVVGRPWWPPVGLTVAPGGPLAAAGSRL